MGVFKKGKNWYIDYRYQGKRIRESVGPSKKLAEQALAARKGEIAQGRFDLKRAKPGRLFQEFAANYLEYSKTNKRSWERDQTSIKALSAHFDSFRLNQITPWHIEKYKQARKKIVKESSVNRELACLKHMYTMAIKWGEAILNPVKEVKMFRERNQRMRFLSPEEEERLLEECNSHLYPIVLTALNTGMRRGEILGLRWNQVDFSRGLIIVENTKNDEIREIPMNATLTRALRDVKVKAAGEHVFSRHTGEITRSVRTAFNNAVRRAELNDLRFHDLRHTFASKLVMAGVDILTVKELLGHKTISMTMRYSHLTQEHKKKAVYAIDGHYLDTRADFEQSIEIVSR